MSRAPLRPRAAYRHWTAISTRWADNDIYGHVNNTVYYQWFDTAVNGWLIEQGLLQIGSAPLIGLVVETGCTYAAPLAYPQAIEVGLVPTRIGQSSVTYALGIFAQGAGEAAAQGHFVHVYVAQETRRPVPLPQEWRDRLGELATES